MNTVLRVKRKYKDPPLISLMVACKRPKTHFLSSDSTTDDPDVKTVAQFAGTLLDVSEGFHKVVPKVLNFENIEVRNSHKRISDLELHHLTKKMKWIGVDSTVEKVKVSTYDKEKGNATYLCNNSDAEDISENATCEEKWMTLINMEDTWSVNFLTERQRKEREKINNYVYDLYYVDMDEDVWFDSTKIFIQKPEAEECYSDIEDEDDSSDSNSESNWRNDYPDTDPFSDSDDENCESRESDSSNSEDYNSSNESLFLYSDEEKQRDKLDTFMKSLSITSSSENSDSSDEEETHIMV